MLNYRDLYGDIKSKAGDAVAYLRLAAGRYPDDPELTALIGELTVRSQEFAALRAGQLARILGDRRRLPVSADSSIASSDVAVSRRSAGTLSPAAGARSARDS